MNTDFGITKIDSSATMTACPARRGGEATLEGDLEGVAESGTGLVGAGADDIKGLARRRLAERPGCVSVAAEGGWTLESTTIGIGQAGGAERRSTLEIPKSVPLLLEAIVPK